VGTLGPAPEVQGEWREGAGLDGCRRVFGIGCEQISLVAPRLFASEQRCLVLMQPGLPTAQLLSVEGEAWRW
ncbi:MAG: hypothetical protein AAEC03_04865, partial [Synechococcus sp.]